MKLLLNVNLYLKVFLFHMLSAWAKHQIVDMKFRVFPKAINPALDAEFPMASTFYFSQWKTYFLQIHC